MPIFTIKHVHEYYLDEWTEGVLRGIGRSQDALHHKQDALLKMVSALKGTLSSEDQKKVDEIYAEAMGLHEQLDDAEDDQNRSGRHPGY